MREDLISQTEIEEAKNVETTLKQQLLEENQELKKKGSEARLLKEAEKLKELEDEKKRQGKIENFKEILVCDQDY